MCTCGPSISLTLRPQRSTGQRFVFGNSLGAAATRVPGVHFKLVDCAVGQRTLDAGTYRIFWSFGDSVMPTSAVLGDPVTVSSPVFTQTFAATSLGLPGAGHLRRA